jgi:hypothetical protein
LKMLELDALVMDSKQIDVLPVSNGSLTCLIIHDCSLSAKHLKLIVSKIPTLRHLALTFRKKKRFESVLDIDDWETFVRMELNLLDRLEFFFSYELSSNDMIFLQSFVRPFQSPFWLKEKRWLVVCECIYENAPSISLYTLPNIYGAYQEEYCSRNYGILFKFDNYYITKYSYRKLVDTTACNVSIGHVNVARNVISHRSGVDTRSTGY